jgi:hypothetical protein
MRSYALALATLLAATALLSGCGRDGDYRVAVSWLINGTTPTPDLCAEQGIAKARFEVRSAGGKRMKTMEASCADTIPLSDANDYGGFYTNYGFDWDTQYFFTLTLVDANGQPVSIPRNYDFTVRDDTDTFELGYLDYVKPAGSFAALSGEWSVRSGDIATPETCGGATDIQTVRIFATSALDEDLLDAVQVAEASCGAGRYTSPGKTLARGYFVFFYEAYSSTNALVEASPPSAPILLDGSTDVLLPRHTFLSPAK